MVPTNVSAILYQTLADTGAIWRLSPQVMVIVGSFGSQSSSMPLYSTGPSRIVADAAMGFCVEKPDGWQSGYQTPEPETAAGGCADRHLRDALSGSAAVAFNVNYQKDGADDEGTGGCRGDDYTYVSLWLDETDTPLNTPISKSDGFGKRDGTGVRAGFDDQACDERNQYIDFVVNDRTLEAMIGSVATRTQDGYRRCTPCSTVCTSTRPPRQRRTTAALRWRNERGAGILRSRVSGRSLVSQPPIVRLSRTR
jgi:hypothetical protein